MIGLLKNNYYSARSSARILSVFMLLAGAFVIPSGSQQLLLLFMLSGIIGFPVNAMAGMGIDHISKWGKYKLTSPVKRADIVRSYYFSHLIWLPVGMIFAGIALVLSWLLRGYPFDRSIDVLMIFSAGNSVSLFAAAIFFPLFYLFGEDRSGILSSISLFCAIGVTLGVVALINAGFGDNMTTWQLLSGAAILLSCSLSAFALSYPTAAAVFRRNEY